MIGFFFPEIYLKILLKEQILRESLEDENRKLMTIIGKREETIRKLEERARNALEISIHADNSKLLNFNSHAVGMAVARAFGFEIDFVINLISGQAAGFSVIILKSILTSIFEIKIHEKNP